MRQKPQMRFCAICACCSPATARHGCPAARARIEESAVVCLPLLLEQPRRRQQPDCIAVRRSQLVPQYQGYRNCIHRPCTGWQFFFAGPANRLLGISIRTFSPRSLTAWRTLSFRTGVDPKRSSSLRSPDLPLNHWRRQAPCEVALRHRSAASGDRDRSPLALVLAVCKS